MRYPKTPIECTQAPSHLVPFPGHAACINAFLSLEGHTELVAHLCGRAAAQLMERILKQVVSPHSNAQASVRSLVTGPNLAPVGRDANE